MYRVLLTALFLASAPASAQDWVVDTEASLVSFRTQAFGGEVEGRFPDYTAAIHLNPSDLSTARIDAAVTTGSGTTGNPQLDQSMLAADGLAPQDHALARFVSADIRATDTGYEAHGTLTLRGNDQPAVLPFTLTITDGRAVADGAVTIARADFGVGGANWGETAAQVIVELHIEADAAN